MKGLVIEEGERLGVDDISIKGFLVGYLDVILVEDLPCVDLGLWWVLGGNIACKVPQITCTLR